MPFISCKIPESLGTASFLEGGGRKGGSCEDGRLLLLDSDRIISEIK